MFRKLSIAAQTSFDDNRRILSLFLILLLAIFYHILLTWTPIAMVTSPQHEEMVVKTNSEIDPSVEILLKYMSSPDGHGFDTGAVSAAIAQVIYRMDAQGLWPYPNISVGKLNIEMFLEILDRKGFLKGPKCLEWTEVFYLKTERFDKVCKEKFEFAHIDAGYCGEKGVAGTFESQIGTGYCGTIYNATSVIPRNFFDLIICTQVFEHLEEPDVGAKQLFEITAPEGLLLWTAPMASPYHTAPGIGDFYRYTLQGATYVLQKAGFCVFYLAGGNTPVMTMLELLSRPEEEIRSGLGGVTRLVDAFERSDKDSYVMPLNNMVLAVKTNDCEAWRSKGNFVDGGIFKGRGSWDGAAP